MAQYKTGTVTLTNGSAAVVGASTSWLVEVGPGDMFALLGDDVFYEVASVTDDTHLNLTAPWAGPAKNAALYVISRDFTPFLDIPYPNEGDLNTASLMKRAMVRIEQKILEKDSGLSVVKSRTTTTPPVSPNNDDTYIIPTGATGLWAGRETQLTTYEAGEWRFITPLKGWRVWVEDEGLADLIFADGVWTLGPMGQAVTNAEAAADLAGAKATEAVQAAASVGTKATEAAASAVAASEAAVDAGLAEDAATAQAGVATTQAGVATTKAAEATTQAGVATTQAGLAAQAVTDAQAQVAAATTQAGIATTKAGEAAASAGVATTKAAEAVQAVADAAGHVTAATTQAGIATAQAAEATTQAGVATTQAGVATNKANEAAASAASANQNAIDSLAAKVDAVGARDATVVYRDAALAARDLAQAFAQNAYGQQVTAGVFSAYHWSEIARQHAEQAAMIAGGNNFGIIGDGTAQRLTATAPGEMFHLVGSSTVQLVFNATTRSITFNGIDAYTKTEVDAAVAAAKEAVRSEILGGAPPDLLNTIDEIAAALNDDATVVATMTGQIAAKANAVDVYTKIETDDAISAAVSALSPNSLTQGDTTLVVTDDGTGFALLTIDGKSLAKIGSIYPTIPGSTSSTTSLNGLAIYNPLGNLRLQAGSSDTTASGASGTLMLYGGFAAAGSNKAGGPLNLNGGNGDGTGAGGPVNVAGGTGATGGTGGVYGGNGTATAGGPGIVRGGNGPQGGNAEVKGGTSSEGDGADVVITATNGVSATGAIRRGGKVIITAGDPANGGAVGDIELKPGTGANVVLTKPLKFPDGSVMASAASGTGGLVNTAVLTGDNTLAAGERARYDTRAGVGNATLPASPEDGDEVALLDVYGSFATHPVFVLRNGKTIDGKAEDFELDVNAAHVVLHYFAANNDWRILHLSA